MAGEEVNRERHSTSVEDVPEIKVTTTQNERRPVVSAIRWGAVLAGVAVGVSVQMALTLLGIATGLTAMSVSEGEASGTGPLIWAGVSMLASAFFGGYVAARMSGLKRKADGVLHGAVSWAVTTILFAVLATSIGGTLLSNVFNNMSHLAQANATANGESPLAVLMRSQGITAGAGSIRQLQQYLQAGERTQAVRHMVGMMGVEPERAQIIVDQALILTGSPEAASPESRATADRTIQTAGSAAWGVFLTVALALAIGIGGGALGAAGSRRADWSGTRAIR